MPSADRLRVAWEGAAEHAEEERKDALGFTAVRAHQGQAYALARFWRSERQRCADQAGALMLLVMADRAEPARADG
jgi:hypothetical protein